MFEMILVYLLTRSSNKVLNKMLISMFIWKTIYKPALENECLVTGKHEFTASLQ